MQKGTLIGTEQRLGHFAYLLEESAFKHQVQQVLFLTSFNYDLLARILFVVHSLGTKYDRQFINALTGKIVSD
jgi:hypothetical protein